jgi:hypothetical protein
VDSGGWLGGVEAGHSEAWASKPADLARHWLGETEDAPEELLQSEPADLARHWLGETEDVLKELLRTVQELEEEACWPGGWEGRQALVVMAPCKVNYQPLVLSR